MHHNESFRSGRSTLTEVIFSNNNESLIASTLAHDFCSRELHESARKFWYLETSVGKKKRYYSPKKRKGKKPLHLYLFFYLRHHVLVIQTCNGSKMTVTWIQSTANAKLTCSHKTLWNASYRTCCYTVI